MESTTSRDQDERYAVMAEPKQRPSHLYLETEEELAKAASYLYQRVNQLYERLVMVMVDDDDTAVVRAVKERPADGARVIAGMRQVTEQLFSAASTLDTIHRRLVLPGDID